MRKKFNRMEAAGYTSTVVFDALWDRRLDTIKGFYI
jgi:hypothetical protein